MKLTAQDIETLASNASVTQKGKELASHNKFSNLKITADGTFLWGECSGSGKNPYFCSADFADEHKPVFRCNCPSRQFPCKHSTGLLFAFQMGQKFNIAEIPAEIVDKRLKIENRAVKKENPTSETSGTTAKPADARRIVKKIELQLSGIETAQKLLQNIMLTGLSGIDASLNKMLDNQIKELGNYYIGGIQTAFNDVLTELRGTHKYEYTDAIECLNYLWALLKKSREYLISKKENPAAPPDLTSAIEEQTGYVWKLTDLMQYGLYEENAEIVQLSYHSYSNASRQEYIDEGHWFNLKNGKIYKSQIYRPYRTLRHIQEGNSCLDALQLPKLFIYPGNVNPRVRWEYFKTRPVDAGDRQKIIAAAASNYAEMVKTVKSTIKNPLMDKNPVMLLQLNRAFVAGKHIVLEDKNGNRLTLADFSKQQIETEALLQSILPEDCENYALTVMAKNEVKTGMLYFTALSVITPNKIIRLLY
ncbi:MAG: SWIM zinc finger family protein [Prevotellaceae bacterium]|jgi:hypothetical protein|nr:SWIM zinc finger family protein [Prevotellaceae bacterium]